jgi:hypothetical protein
MLKEKNQARYLKFDKKNFKSFLVEGESLGFISLDGMTKVPIEINCKLRMGRCVENKHDLLALFEMCMKRVSLARVGHIL